MGDWSPTLIMARISSETKEKVRARLLATAARHFARNGLSGANVDRISLDAGYAKGTLYNYFRSKEQLFATVIEQAAHRAAEQYAAAESGMSTRERLTALAVADMQVLREDEAFTQVLVREAMSFRSETYPLIVEHLAPFVAEVEKVLADGVARAEVRSGRPVAQLALMFVGWLSLLYVQHWGSGRAWPTLDEIPELAVTTFLDGAASRGDDRERTTEP